MKILMVAPRFSSNFGDYYFFPMGLAYVSAALKKAKFNVHCLDLNLYNEEPAGVLRREIAAQGADVVCVGGLSAHYKNIRLVCRTAKEARKDLFVIVGGGLVTSEPELVMGALGADCGVIGEGEETIVELVDALCEGKSLENVPGIIFTIDGSCVRTPARPEIQDLDSIAPPDYEGFRVDKYIERQMPGDVSYLYPFDQPRELPIITSRSCPYNCTFCYHPLGQKYRQRSLDNLLSEVQQLVQKYRVNILGIYDELFSADKKRLQEFCERIKPMNLKWFAQLRVADVERDTLRKMKESGCFVVAYGLESASDAVLKSMKKHTTLGQIENALRLTREEGIGIQGYFIFGDKAETELTVKETLDWWNAHPSYSIGLAMLQTYPGSPLYWHAVASGVIRDRLQYVEEGCPVVNLTSIPDEKFRALVKYTKGVISPCLIEPVRIVARSCGSALHKGLLFHIEVECPHCKHTNVFRRLNNISRSFFFSCRQCNQRFNMSGVAMWFIEDMGAEYVSIAPREGSGRAGFDVMVRCHRCQHLSGFELAGFDAEISVPECRRCRCFLTSPERAGVGEWFRNSAGISEVKLRVRTGGGVEARNSCVVIARCRFCQMLGEYTCSVNITDLDRLQCVHCHSLFLTRGLISLSGSPGR